MNAGFFEKSVLFGSHTVGELSGSEYPLGGNLENLKHGGEFTIIETKLEGWEKPGNTWERPKKRLGKKRSGWKKTA